MAGEDTNGLIKNIRDPSREIQVEAFEWGLISCIPADRGGDSQEED